MSEVIYFYPEGHQAHAQPGHPERPERVDVIRDGLQEVNYWEGFPHVEPEEVPREILTSLHTEGYLEQLQSTSSREGFLDLDTYTTAQSWDLALRAAGGGIAVSRAVWDGKDAVGFALTRPPGHHATQNKAMGFCLLNNVAIAAEYLLQEKGAEKVAIVDLDLHHGNGTQDIFYDRGDVMYLSTHQSPFYPGTGHLSERGTGAGEGLTVNMPLPPGSGDRAFRAMMDEVILPFLARFAPDMVLVSYGYDTHWRDPLGSLLLSARMYAQLIGTLYQYATAHCRGRLCLILEGGYDLEAGKACAQGIVATLLGEAWEDPLGDAPRDENDAWRDTLQSLVEIWSL